MSGDRRYLEVMLQFYRRLSGEKVTQISDIPSTARTFLAGMHYMDMLRPLLVDALRDGATVGSLSSYYGVSARNVRRIRDEFGIAPAPLGRYY